MAKNQLSKYLHYIDKASPEWSRSCLYTLLFNSQVRYAGLSGIRIEEWNSSNAKVSIKNRWRVQNHIGGVHACAMSLLAETATGIVFGRNVPDSHIPLIQSMKVSYLKRSTGDLTAVAFLSDEEVGSSMNSCVQLVYIY